MDSVQIDSCRDGFTTMRASVLESSRVVYAHPLTFVNAIGRKTAENTVVNYFDRAEYLELRGAVCRLCQCRYPHVEWHCRSSR